MTEQQPRPAATRGRSSTRGGRGGFSGRGGHRNGNKTNGDLKDAAASDASSDQGELGELKKRYSAQLNTLRELFPDWTDVDFVMALQESDGDLQATIERITEGMSYTFLWLPLRLPMHFVKLPELNNLVIRQCHSIRGDQEEKQR